MHVINYLTTSETVGYRKPHPKIFEDMIDQLGVKPSEIMYVGDDALNDVAPARAMGMVSVWYKQEDAELEPLTEEVDYTITTIEELLKILPDNFETEGEKNNMAMDLILNKTVQHYTIVLWDKDILSYSCIPLLIIMLFLMI